MAEPANRIAAAFDVAPPASETDDVELILGQRYRTVSQDAALDRLMRNSAVEGPEEDSRKDAQEPRQPVRYIGETWRRVGAVAGDAAIGVVETPRQIVGGVRDAGQAFIDLADILQDVAPLGGIRVDSDGLRLLSSDEQSRAQEAGEGLQLPQIGEPDSVTGGIVRGVSQFLTGFFSGGALLKTFKVGAPTTTAGRVGQAAMKGAIADFAAFDEQEKRLSNLVEEFPALANPVTAYLAADPADGAMEGRFKNAVEGLGLGVATEGLYQAVRLVRAVRNVRRAQPRGAAALEAGEDVTRPVRAQALGDTETPLTVRPAEAGMSPEARLAEAFSETEPGVPSVIAAASLTERGLRPLADGELFVNFARINAPEDIQRVIQDTADAMQGSIDDARRGVRTHDQTRLAAADIDAWETLLTRRAGAALNAEQSVAARELWVASGDRLREAADMAFRDPSEENLFVFRRMLATHHAVQKEVIAARTETARALNAWRIPVGGDRERLSALESVLNRGGGLDVSRELARAVLAADAMGGRGAVSAFVEKGLWARSRDAVLEYWINALLSGPKTHMVNMLSNASVIGLSMAEHAVAARIGRLIGTQEGAEVGEALAQWHGVRTALREAFSNAAKAFRSGETGFGVRQIEGPPERAISSAAWNMRSGTWQARAVDSLGAVATLPGRALISEDEFFKTIGYRMSVHAQAFRKAQHELAAGRLNPENARSYMADLMADPPEEIRLSAAANAAYQTFTSEPGPIVRKLNALRNNYPMLRLVVPFLNTPANIFKYTFERTPLAPFMGRYRAAIDKGGAAADLARSRLALGTATTLLALDLALDGRLTGSGPDNRAERSLLFRSGWRPYSLRVDDTYVAFNRLDPIGNLLQFGGDIGEFMVNAQEMDYDSDVLLERSLAATVFAAAEALNSKAMLIGLSDIIEAMSDPNRFGPSYIKRLVGSFVPVGVREAANVTAPVARTTAGIVDELKARIPGFADDVAVRRDVWGREIRYESGLGRLYDAVSPLYGSQFSMQPIDRAMMEDGWYIGNLPKYFSVDGARINFSDRPDIHARYLELRGQTRASALGDEGLVEQFGDVTLFDALNAMVTGGGGEMGEAYALRPDAESRERFLRSKVIRSFQDAAKAKLLEEFPELRARAEENALRQRHLSVPLPAME